MPKVNSRQFLEVARRSRLVAADDLSRIQKQWKQDSKLLLPEDPEEVANRFVEEGLLNRWQAQHLLKGKYKGFVLGKYKLLGHLGTGGMSHVYLAEHSVMQRLVAIKVLPKKFVENSSYLERFRREARAVAALDHPNIVRAYDIDLDAATDTHYIVMEYVDGRDLQKIVKDDGPCDPLDAADYIAQAALGLQHAHNAGLIHRDVKPANCLVDSKDTVKLLDLGLAKFSEEDRSISALHDDSVVGTADYLAPEQARNSQTVDGRADIYGLGCTLYFLLTGRPPFPDGTIAQRLLKHQNETPTSIYELRPDAPPSLVECCRRMMIKSPEERTQSASAVADELKRWLATRGRALSATYAEVGIDRELTANSPSGSGRISRLSRSLSSGNSSVLPKRLGSTPGPNDTVSSTKDDTRPSRRNTSTANDDLTLAPLDEEHPSPAASGIQTENADASMSGSSSSLFRSSERTKTAADSSSGILGAPSSQSDPAIGMENGPVESLLDDPELTSAINLPKRQLTTRSSTRRQSVSPRTLLIGGAIVAFLTTLAFIAFWATR